jgi:GTP pyrophosphokinase
MENIRKTLLATAKDVRVMFIKLADRLHNLRTLDYKSGPKQRSKSAETIEIYAPIAHRLGMQKVKWELEDRAIQYLDPDACVEIQEFLETNSAYLQNFLDTNRCVIEGKLREEGVEAEVQSRLKHKYSIYRKMYSQNKGLNEVHDLCAFRVIVSTIGECYHVLGALDSTFQPVPGKMKNYIASPKPNGYKSIHNTYLGHDGILFEIQIRTREMHEEAEYGVAAHWKYKKGGDDGVKTSDENQYAWIRDMLNRQEGLDPEEFRRDLKSELFSDEVMVFTPKGKVVTLPAGATPIDFAYRLHSDIGNHISGAKLNGRIIPIDSKLESGGIVEILTSNSTRGPSLDWLEIVRSSEARGKIRQWFKKERRAETVALGKSSFDDELRRAKLTMTEVIKSGALEEALQKLSFRSPEDMFASIGIRSRSASQCVHRIRDEMIRITREPETERAIDFTQIVHSVPRLPVNSHSGVLVDGLPDCEVKFARCCSPIPGDDIVGFITLGHGISVHRADCDNYRTALVKGLNPERWINVSWGNTEKDTYLVGFYVLAQNRKNLIIDIMGALNSAKVSVDELNAQTRNPVNASVFITIKAHSAEEAATVSTKLQHVQGVTKVERRGTD